MRVLVLCAAAFAGGLLAGAVFWPSSAPSARRASEGVRETPTSVPRTLPEAGAPETYDEADAPGLEGRPSSGATPLRDLAGDAAAELSRVLDRPAAQAFLEGDGTITGSVRDPAGEPVAGVIVTASPEAQPFDLAATARRARERAHEDIDLGAVARDAIQGELWRRQARHTTRTDAGGRYELKGLVEGWHRLTAFHEDYDVRPDPQFNRVQPDAVVDFRAQPVMAVPVEVRLPDGELADNAWVSWQGPQGSGWDTWKPEPGTVRLPKASCRVKAQTSVPDALQSPEVAYEAVAGAAPLVLRLEGRRALVAMLVPAEGLSVPEGVEFRLRRLEGRADVDPASLQGDEARSGSSSQGRATWYDLEPGRYLVAAFLGGRHLLAHAVAEMGEGSIDVELPFDAPAAGTYVTAKLLVQDGGPVAGNARFLIVTGSGERVRHHPADALRREDGTWLVLLPESLGDGADAAALLRAAVGAYGTAQEAFDPRHSGPVTIRFREPSRVRLRVERLAGSGVEGRLFAALWGEEGGVATRQIEADGRCDLGAVQPKDYSLLLFVRERDTRWTILSRKVALGAGDQEQTVAVPALHTLRVRPSPKLRATEVVLLSSDPAIGWMRRTERVDGEVATFEALAAAAYEIRCGNKRVEVRVPGPDEMTVE
jgi:hypothetical protein